MDDLSIQVARIEEKLKILREKKDQLSQEDQQQLELLEQNFQFAKGLLDGKNN